MNVDVGTQFQFRTIGDRSLVAVSIAMPPWPGDHEVIFRKGIWNGTLTKIENSSTRLVNSFALFVTLFIVNIL